MAALLLLLFQQALLCALSLAFPTPPSPTPASDSRFLHFSIWANAEWWLDPRKKMLAVVENGVNERQQIGWQMLFQLLKGNHGRFVSVKALDNEDNEATGQIRAERLEMCHRHEAKGEESALELEIELWAHSLLVARGRHTARYLLPAPLSQEADVRIYFVRLDHQEGHRHRWLCQLRSEMEAKQTSKFPIPPTTPLAAISTDPSLPPQPTDSPHSTLPPIRARQKWPYKRRVKAPRRSTDAAQRMLEHYSRGPRREFHTPLADIVLPARQEEKRPAASKVKGTVPYIDIVADKEQFREVQWSRTNEINSHWSPTFLAFGSFVVLMVTLSSAFAMVMFALLQCTPREAANNNE